MWTLDVADRQKDKPAVSGLDSTGRYIRFDDRGNAIWKWRTEEGKGVEDIDRTFSLLASLDNDALTIEDSQLSPLEDTGTDPYNSAARKPRSKP